MLKIELIKKWAEYQDCGGTRNMPSKIFSSTELVLVDGEIKEIEREPGQHNIGMITWRCHLCSPEYPEGRDIVLIANDVTHKAGSFGVDEDVLFQKASAYAREKGLPRIHIACNSGARVGLAEELKPFFKVKWTNDDPSKGFDYLYLEEEDLKSLPDDAVDVHVQRVNGKKHFVIDAIIGEGLKSTKGGIGVENLQGSGLIAGETSKAYNEVFTLSYVTGRSVGIGAYLNRLGQRVIQMVNGPMILTGAAGCVWCVAVMCENIISQHVVGDRGRNELHFWKFAIHLLKSFCSTTCQNLHVLRALHMFSRSNRRILCAQQASGEECLQLSRSIGRASGDGS